MQKSGAYVTADIVCFLKLGILLVYAMARDKAGYEEN